MNTRIRKHLERAQRVAAFCLAHPSPLRGYTLAVARLNEALARAADAAVTEVDAAREERAAVAIRLALKEQLEAELRMVAGLARSTRTESVTVPIILRAPGARDNLVQFITTARQVVSRATEARELLEEYGLPPGQLEEIGAHLDQFEQLILERDKASRSHIGARQELMALARELKRLVEQLETINRFRFRDDPGALVAWRACRDIRISHRKPRHADVAEPAALPPSAEGSKTAA
jgi:hypothetical protein